MSTDKHIDRICTMITIFALLLTVLFMNGEKLGLKKVVDADAEKYSDLANFTAKDQDGEWDTADATVIMLNGDSASVSGNGAYVNGGTVVITNAGYYVVSGTLNDGFISVDAYDSSKVWIMLDGVNITSSDNACIRVEQADKVFLTLAEGSENFLTSGAEFSQTALDDGTGGAVFAHDDLTINGSGSLTIVSGYKHGIDANDDLIITGGTISITAPADGIHANDSLRIMNAELTVDAGDDGLVVSNEGGYLVVESGTLNITSADDAVHTAGDITISGGTFNISAGDDGIHSDTAVVITDGVILISECYEGIEAVTIDIAGGEITIYPTDDGLNANGGSMGMGMMGGYGQGAMGGPAGTPFGSLTETVTAAADETAEADTDENEIDTWVRISGGILTIINSDGNDADGIDSNGDLIITGGTIRVSLPGGGTNNAIDFGSESGGKATISGGDLMAAGGSMMSENFDESSEQPVILYNLDESVEGGTTVLVLDADENEVISYTPSQSFNSIFLSSPELKIGETYIVVIGDTEEELTLDADAVTIGSSGMGGMNFRSGGGMGRGGGRGGNRFSVTPTADGSGSSEEATETPFGASGFGPGGPAPANGEMPEFDGTMMPQNGGMGGFGQGGQAPADGETSEFDGTMMPQNGGMGDRGGGMGGPGGMPGFEQQETEEEETSVSSSKALSEFGPETWILLGTSVLVLLAGILFALRYRR